MLPPEWWDLTPYEQGIVHEGAAKKRTDDFELGAYIAWHVAAFSRAKKLPSWSEVRMSIRGETKKAGVGPMSAAQIKSFFKGLKDATPPALTEKEQRMLAKRQARAKGKR